MKPSDLGALIASIPLTAAATANAGIVTMHDVHTPIPTSYQAGAVWFNPQTGQNEFIVGGGNNSARYALNQPYASGSQGTFPWAADARDLASTGTSLYKITASGQISAITSPATLTIPMDADQARGLAVFSGTPWGDIIMTSGRRDNQNIIIGTRWDTNEELFSMNTPFLYDSLNELSYDNGVFNVLASSTSAPMLRHYTISDVLSNPTLHEIAAYQVEGIGGGGLRGIAYYDNMLHATTPFALGRGDISIVPGPAGVGLLGLAGLYAARRRREE